MEIRYKGVERMTLAQTVFNYGKLVKFSHSVFALPFAISMLIILMRDYPIGVNQLAWILVAMVSARTAAMGFNRIVDRDIDAKNPRTKEREIPSGVVSTSSAKFMTTLAALIFLFSAAALGTHCLALAPLVLGILFLYSYTKRFTSLSHYVLGLSLGMAPGGVWYAITGRFAWEPIPLMLAVLFWVGGFDIIYSCQDFEFDRTSGLRSLPSQLGLKGALAVSRALHLISLLCLIWFGRINHLGSFYYIGVSIFATLLLNQQRLVSPEDLSKIDLAFFTRNGQASIIFLVSVALDSYLR